YFHVYLNTLRANLGDPAVVIDAQQVEDTAGILRRLRGADGLVALRVVAVIRDTAIDDAAQAAARIVDHLTGVAMHRAILHAPDDRFAGDQLAIHVTRHWYQHCYDDHIHGATRSRHPLAEVTDGQEREVANVLSHGEVRRIIGADGIPLVTAQGTTLTRLDRDLAAGLAGLVSPLTDVEHHTDPGMSLRNRVTRTWAELGNDERNDWLHRVGVHHVPASTGWSELPGQAQSDIIRLYLDSHRPDQVATPFSGGRIDGDPRGAAATMFSHTTPLGAHDVAIAVPANEPTLPGGDLLATSMGRPLSGAYRHTER
ncbi:hypothetical protein, partial [Paracoccus sp. (in: a-proteobacteria)]|uniref:hypothetical protein n=1 Tax=Paracoccus sp. TaxID=267 RepID=UPI00322072F7